MHSLWNPVREDESMRGNEPLRTEEVTQRNRLVSWCLSDSLRHLQPRIKSPTMDYIDIPTTDDMSGHDVDRNTTYME